jgi:endonuclease YncB( thermonuclease family)
MFHFLHKAVLLAGYGLLATLCMVAYMQRARFQPLIDLVEIGIHYPADRKKVIAEITGEVTKVNDGDSFQIKGPPAMVSVRLAGLEAPNLRKAKDAFNKSLAGQSKTNLSQLILSNQVTVKILHTNQFRAGAGIVFLHGTNINAEVVRQGLARMNSTYAEGLPTRDRKVLERAEQQAMNQRLGIWEKKE